MVPFLNSVLYCCLFVSNTNQNRSHKVIISLICSSTTCLCSRCLSISVASCSATQTAALSKETFPRARIFSNDSYTKEAACASRISDSSVINEYFLSRIATSIFFIICANPFYFSVSSSAFIFTNNSSTLNLIDSFSSSNLPT